MGRVSKLAPYIDGQEHRIIPESVGMRCAKSVATAFTQACYGRGKRGVTRIDGDACIVQSFEPIKKPWKNNRRLSYTQPVGDDFDDESESAATLRRASEFFRVSEAFLDTNPNTPKARELSARLVQLSRAAQ